MKCIFEVNTICKLCLRVDEKVYRLDNTHHKAFIESIIKLKQFNYVPTDDEYVCYICNALLTKTFNFMQTVWNAQEIICDILKNSDKITKPMLQHIDRHNNGLNPITLSSVVICENVKYESCDDSIASTDIEELDLDLLIDKIEGESKKKLNINKIENHSINEKRQIIGTSSNEERNPDKCNLDEVEVEIDVSFIKTETGDPLTKDFNTNANDDPKPEPKKINVTKKNALYKKRASLEGSTSREKKSKPKEEDEDYQPDSTSHSEDSDYDSYNDEGKAIKRPKNNRVYPRKCDHCDYEVLRGRDHYRHYLCAHPNVEYPYKIEKNYACSICGQLCTNARLRSHEASHATQKLKCTLCPNVYSSKLKLYRHMTSVHTNKKFTCDYCSKTFKGRHDMIRHIRIHTGSKPFKCHICGDGFAHSGNRNIHIRSKHQNYKYVPKKHKRTQKMPNNNKHISTDTEIASNKKKTIRKTKKKCNTKM